MEIFSWWDSIIDENKIGKSVSVPLRFSDANNSPAMVEQTFGKGKAITFTIPADADWSLWPGDQTFVPVMIEMVDDLVSGNPSAASDVYKRQQ